jgi:hypothetical protein
VARTGKKSNSDRVSVGQAERRGHLEDLGVDERIILKRTYKK